MVFFTLGTAFAQADLQPVALIRLTKTEPITVKQLRTEIEKLEAQYGKELSAEEKRQVLDIMINERLALQAAERDGVVINDAELDQQFAQARQSMAQSLGRMPTDAEFNAAIRDQTGLDSDAFKEQLRRQMTVQKYLMSEKQDVLESITPPSEAEILETYELSKARLIRPDTVRFSMIFIPYGQDAESRAKAKETAERLERDINGTSSKFDEALIRAQAAGSGYQGGDGGYLPKTPDARQVVGAEFMQIAFALDQGEVSRLIENQRGYQIIKITETYAQKLLELDDIHQLGSRATVRDYIANMLFQQKQQRVFEEASNDLVNELRTGNSFQVIEQNLNW